MDARAPDRSAAAGEPWHARDVPAVADAHAVTLAHGLSGDEVARRREAHGPNALPEPEKRSALGLFLAQFRSGIIGILAIAAVLALVVGETVDAVVIAVVLLLNGVLGFVQEHRAEQSLEALRSMLVATTTVRRDGRAVTVDTVDVVPGDVVLLDAGNRVPADGRVAVSESLEVDESALTGESTPSGKRTAPIEDAEAPLGDRHSTAFMNTVVTRGRGELIVTATGAGTQMGALARGLSEAEDRQTPLGRQMDALGRRLSIVALLAVSLVIALGLVRGDPLAETLLTGIALAVAAIPEGLPAVVTVTLALGLRSMAGRGAIVKRLHSAETLGSTTVICSDKTGTLTLNQMTARALVFRGRTHEVTGEGYDGEGTVVGAEGVDLDPVMRILALCNDSSIDEGRLVGDPTEGGLLALAIKAGADPAALARAHPRLGEVPFDSAHKFMATAHEVDGERWLYVKGAPDVLLARAETVLGPDGAVPLADVREALEAELQGLARQGLRVLGAARRRLDGPGPEDLDDAVAGLELVGFVGLLDPPRAEVRDAIATCHDAGIAVKVITGDHADTATAIAASLGIEGGTITGRELARIDDEELAARIHDLAVFARVSPQDKVRVVQALHANGAVTAMTGDGVNDAPALREADIGVAMGRGGTEVAKEAAAMVLTDDDFTTIVAAVEEGRRIYDDIVAFVRFQLSTNIGAILTLLIAPLLALPLPFTPIQVLFVNLLADGPPAMALGLDPASPDAMRRAPRDPGAPILSARRLARLLWFGAIMTVGTLGAFQWARSADVGVDEARTMAFVTFVLFQVVNALNARTEDRSVFGRHTLTNRWLWLALAGVVLLLVAVVSVPPLASLIGATAIPAAWWGVAAAVALSILVLEELRKLASRS